MTMISKGLWCAFQRKGRCFLSTSSGWLMTTRQRSVRRENYSSYDNQRLPTLVAAAGVVVVGIIPSSLVQLQESLPAIKADDLYNQKEYDRRELMHYLRQCVKGIKNLATLIIGLTSVCSNCNWSIENPQDADLLWRLARAEYDVANLNATSSTEKKELIYSAHSTIQNALEKAPENFAVHKWYVERRFAWTIDRWRHFVWRMLILPVLYQGWHHHLCGRRLWRHQGIDCEFVCRSWSLDACSRTQSQRCHVASFARSL